MKSNTSKTKNSTGLKNCRVLALLIAVLVCLPLLLASCGKAGPSYDIDKEHPEDINGSDGNTGIKNDDAKPGDAENGNTPTGERKIIYNANVSAETKEFDKAVSGI